MLFTIFIGFFDAEGQNLFLKVKGNDTIQTKTIDSIGYQKSFEDFNALYKTTKELNLRLQYLGYLETFIRSFTKKNDSTYFATVDIGKRYKNVRIYITENFDKSLLKGLTTTKTDSNYLEVKIQELETTLNELNKRIVENGDPFSSLRLKDIRNENTNIVADLKVAENNTRTIDSIIIKGYDKFPKSFVKRYLKIKKGAIFNLEKIKEKTKGLNALQFADQIKDPEILFTRDSTSLYLYIDKTKSNSFDGFLGFGTNEETNKLEFDGYLNLILINNLNYGESLRLLYKSDEIDQRTFDVKASLPYIFSSPLNIHVGLNIFRKDSTFQTTSQFARLSYSLNPNNTIGLGIEGFNSSNLLKNSTVTLDDFKSNFYTINYTYVRPQVYDNLFPINTFLDLSIGLGNREQASTNLNQTKATLNAFKIFNLNDRNSIYLNISGAYLQSDNYLENELFRFGGINSIRGFEENSLTANLFAVLNTEYRYKVSNSFYIHSVLDASYSENNIANSESKLFGFGFGFGILTKAGLFKFNYASAKTENQKFRLSDSKIHISLTSRF